MIRRMNPGFEDEAKGLPLFDTLGAPAPSMSSGPSSTLAPARVDMTPITPQDPRVRGTVEEPRLSRQSQAILDRLRQRPASNADLMLLAQRFGARIHDLRAAGFPIEIIDRDRETGLTWYALEKPC